MELVKVGLSFFSGSVNVNVDVNLPIFSVCRFDGAWRPTHLRCITALAVLHRSHGTGPFSDEPETHSVKGRIEVT